MGAFGLWLGSGAAALRRRRQRSAVTEHMVSIQPPVTMDAFRAALRYVLEDPRLEVYVWSADRQQYVDGTGTAPAPDGAGLWRHDVHDADGGPLALVVTSVDPGAGTVLLDAAVRAAAPGLRQVREHAELLARLRELESAGAGGDAGHGGHRRTREVAAIIGSTRAAADPAVRALTARAETVLRHALRDLCDAALGGEWPAEPDDLESSVRALAAAMPLPVRVTAEVGPLPPAVAATVYGAICEALANVVGHARARQVVVTLRRHGPTVQLAVSDDGDGGAQPVIGGGIVVLAARVAALGGLLHLDSPAGSGTHLTVELPAGP